MKKLILLSLFALVSLSASAQTFSGQSGDTIRVVPPFKFCLGADNGQDNCVKQTGVNAAKWSGSLDFAITPLTVAQLPPASLSTGRIYRVTDGNSSSDCSTGLASTSVLCTSNGSSWAAIGGGGGSPGGANTQIQINNAGSFGAISNAAAGSALVSQGVSALPIFQAKPTVDVRDIAGVDCTGGTDSGPALNTWISSGAWKVNGAPVRLVIPGLCGSSATLINLATTWLIKNTQGLSIECQAGDGPLNPGFAWFGANGGTMVDAEYNYGLHIDGCSFYGQGASTFAGVGINIDKTGAGGSVNTTDNTITHNWFAGGAPAFSTYTAIAISLVSGANVEDMTINDNTIGCTQSGNPVGIGIHLGSSANAKNERFIHNEIHNCATGVEQDGGTMDIEYTEFGNNTVDLQIAGWSDPNEVIANNLSESEGATQKFLVASQAGSGGQPINFYGNNIPVNTVCAIDLKNSVVSGSSFNTFYPSTSYTSAGSTYCNSTDGGFMGTMIGGSVSNNGLLLPTLQSISPLVYDSTTHLHNTFLEGSTSTTSGPNLWISTTPHELLLTTGASLLERAVFYGSGGTADSFNGLTADTVSTQNVTPCGINSWCGPLEGGLEITGIATPDGIYLNSTNLGAGSTHYDFYVSAVDGSGNETLLRGQNPFFGTTGSTPLSGGNFIIIGGLGSPGAASCNIYAVNPSNALQVNKIITGVSCAAAWTQNITSYPSTWPITTVQSPFNKTLAFLFRGKEIDFQYGTPLKGFSDQGSTATWSIGSNGQFTSNLATGTAPFVVSSTTPVANLSIGGNAATATSASGLVTVPFCAGYTPSNSQLVQYTTGSSPNPCYTATTGGTGTVTVSGAGTLTSTALVTGAGSQISQTPSATSTLDSSGNLTAAGQIKTNVTTGTAPFIVASTTPVANLSIGGNAATATTATNAQGLTGTPNIAVGTVSAGTLTSTSATFSSNAAIAGPRPWIDVTAPGYAADPTGVADSAAAFNSAIAACAGGTVLVPPGTYIFSSAMTFNASCNIVGNGSGSTRPVLRKNFNSTASGFIRISGTTSNVSLSNVEIDGNSGSFTGFCVVDNANGSRHTFTGNYIHNCEGMSMNFTNGTSLSEIRISDNDIVCGIGATSGNANGIAASQNVSHVLIHHNHIDCHLNTQTPAGAITMHSADAALATSIAHVTIDDNEINPPVGTGTSGAWAIEIGTFAGYGANDVVIKGNRVLLLSNGGGFSLQQILGLVVSGNNFDTNGFNPSYTALEMIGNYGTVVSNNHFVVENPSAAISNNCMVVEDNQATISNNTCDGFGENSALGVSAIVIGGTHASQAISSMSMTNGVISITIASPPLFGWFSPNIGVYISGSTTAGYNGYCKTINTGYVRASGTIQCKTSVVTGGDAASCSTGCGAAVLAFAQSNNTFSGNTVTFGVGALTTSVNPLICIDIRSTGSNEIGSNNNISGNTCIALNNTVVANTIGVFMRGTGTIDSTLIQGNTFINLAEGVHQNNGTNAQILNNIFVNTTTPVNINTGTVAASTWPLAFGKYNACVTGMDGFRGEVTDNNTAVSFGATVTGGGTTSLSSAHVSMRCNGASAGPKWTITGN